MAVDKAMQIIQRQEIGDDYVPPSNCLYFLRNYLLTQKHDGLRIFQLYIKDTVLATALFMLSDDVAHSSAKAPFGSILLRDHLDHGRISRFLQEILTSLGHEKVKEVKITLPPSLYSSFPELDVFLKSGFQIAHTDINQHLPLSEDPVLHTMEKRKLKRALESGIQCQLLSQSMAKEVYEFIVKCRKERGLPVNIAESKFLELISSLPDRYLLFGAMHQSALVAVCVVGAVTEKIAYYFLPATASSAMRFSPMVPLMLFIQDFLKRKGFEYFDLGVSSVEGQVQEGLHTFKKRMGAIDLPKHTLTLKLQDRSLASDS